MYDFNYYISQASSLLLALVVLLVGWIVASIVSKGVYKGLTKANINTKLFADVEGNPPKNVNVSTIIRKFVFWIILIVAFIISLNLLNLSFVAEPFSNMISQLLAVVPNIVMALILFVVAWIIARSVSYLIKKLGRRLPVTEFLQKTGLQEESEESNKVIDTISSVVFYFILLLFIPAILSTLNIQGIAQPFTNMVDSILNFIPSFFAAALIFIIGWFFAKILRSIIGNFLNSLGSENLAKKLRLEKFLEGTSLGEIVGTIVFVLIMIPVTISSLEQLQIRGITTPAINMLNNIMLMLPNILVALILILLGVWLSRWLKHFVDQLLVRLGFNNILSHVGLSQLEDKSKSYTPSQIVGVIVQIVVILLFVGEALQVLNLAFFTGLITAVIAYLPHVLAAILILGVAFFFGHFAEKILSSILSGELAKILSKTAKYSILILAIFMALNQLGVASTIVNAAFILLLGGLSLAFGLAFGLGGREFASKYLSKWDHKIDDTHINKTTDSSQENPSTDSDSPIE